MKPHSKIFSSSTPDWLTRGGPLKLDPTSKLFQWPYFSQRPLACILSSSPILAYLEIFFCKFSWPWLFPDIGSDFFPKTTEKCKSRHLRKKVLSRVSSKLYFVIKIVLNYCEKKLFWTTVRKNCSIDREKLWNSMLKAENFQRFWDH